MKRSFMLSSLFFLSVLLNVNATDSDAYNDALSKAVVPPQPAAVNPSKKPVEVEVMTQASPATVDEKKSPTDSIPDRPETDQGDKIERPPAKSATPNLAATTASGTVLLPERPSADLFSVHALPAEEVVLRFAREYRISAMLTCDPDTSIEASVAKRSVGEMLREVFPAPKWSVRKRGRTWLIEQTPGLKFGTLRFAEIDTGGAK